MAQDAIAVAEPNWASGRAMAALVSVVIESKLGQQVEIVPGANAVIFAGMDRGKGEIDVHPDVWLPNLESLRKEFIEEKQTVRLSENYYTGFSAFCALREFAEANNITSVFDLATPEAAALFDKDGDGMGEIWVGAPGWTSTNQNLVKVRDYGIANFFEPVQTEEQVASASFSSAMERGEGAVFYCYAPHYNWFVFDMIRLEEPPFDPEHYVMVNPNEDPAWFEKSKITVGDQDKTVHVAYSASLEERAPLVAEFLSRIAMDTDTVNAFTNEIVVKGRAPREVAEEWVAANSERIDEWLGL
ncbi:glycine/betaine ABC transporter substrate-binding protein [Salipiger sp. P9]|uniref:ABC transporter substrate-binding protein n=1 Tax=Salipiger pentaromativorans TaxID=2943193 RepID=UPI002158766C|nr:glycine betaine ABC transporter substrate-binding protein [Salipiger pentaromativorans]MCR8549156.1 glycine/betaine ABC transporter substrate-binding protein [Salipiger pentaromativorans]